MRDQPSKVTGVMVDSVPQFHHGVAVGSGTSGSSLVTVECKQTVFNSLEAPQQEVDRVGFPTVNLLMLVALSRDPLRQLKKQLLLNFQHLPGSTINELLLNFQNFPTSVMNDLAVKCPSCKSMQVGLICMEFIIFIQWIPWVVKKVRYFSFLQFSDANRHCVTDSRANLVVLIHEEELFTNKNMLHGSIIHILNTIYSFNGVDHGLKKGG